MRDRFGTSFAQGRRVLYTAKCFWPGLTEDDLRLAAARAETQTRNTGTTFQGALYLPGDELVLCLFYANSRADVKQASERAGMPCERVIESRWVTAARGPALDGKENVS
jgi:hypothetical protein